MVLNHMKHSPLITALASPVNEVREAECTAASVQLQRAADYSCELFYLSSVLTDPRAGDLPAFPKIYYRMFMQEDKQH